MTTHEDHDSGSDDGHSDDQPDFFEFGSIKKSSASSLDSATAAISRLHLDHNQPNDKIDWFDKTELYLALFMYFLGLAVQAFLAANFYMFWVEVKEDPYEDSYFHPMKFALQNATILNASLTSSMTMAAAKASQFCIVNKAPPFIHFMVLWIFFGWSLNLIGDAIWRFYLIYSLKHVDEGHWDRHNAIAEEVLDPPPDERKMKVNISHMSISGKTITMVFVLVPHLIVVIFMAYCGAKYISVTTQVDVLVKASLKMGFLANMDKVIYQSYVSYNWEHYVSNCQYLVHDWNDDHCKWVDSWVSTVMKGMCGVLLGYLCSNFIWSNVEELRTLCRAYYQLFPWEELGPGKPPLPAIKGDWWYPDL